MNSRIPRVFVGSSTEGLRVAETVQIALDHTHEVTLWSQGVFGLGEGSLDSLVKRLDSFDFAILVLTPDDLVQSRGISQQSPRDNVLLEFGLFAGRLGPQRTFALYDRSANIKIPSDLAGVTKVGYRIHETGNLDASLGAPCAKIKTAIETIGIRASQLGERPTRSWPFWDLLSDRIIILFGVDLPASTKQDLSGSRHPSLSPNDLNAAFRISSFLAANYPHKEIVPLAADQDTLPVLLSRKGDLILIGGFVSNAEYARHREHMEARYRARMGRICYVPEQRVYHPQVHASIESGDAPLDPLVIENLPANMVALDHSVVRSFYTRIYDIDRRIVTIAGIKGTATMAAAGYLATNSELATLLPANLNAEVDIEMVLTSSFRNGFVEATSLARISVDGIVISDRAAGASVPCELGQPCDGCNFGVSAHPLTMNRHYFQAVIFDLDDTLIETYELLIEPIEMKAALEMLRVQKDLGSSDTVSPESLATFILQLRRRYPYCLIEKLRERYPRVSAAALKARRVVEESVDLRHLRMRGDHLMLLRTLSQRYYLFLLTEGHRRLQEAKLQSLGVAPLFQDVIITSPEDTAGKEDGLRRIVEQYSFDPDRVVVVGNRLDKEIRLANLLGLTTIWVSVGEGAEMPFSDPLDTPNFQIHDLNRLEYALVMLKSRGLTPA